MCKAVQNFRTFAKLLDCQSVILLIQEKSCLLPVFYVNFIFYTIFFNLHKCWKLWSYKTLNHFHSFLFAHLHIASFVNTANSDPIFCQDFPEEFYDCFFKTIDPQSQWLNYQYIRKFIHHNSRKEICLCKNQTTASCIYHFLTIFPCITYTLLQKFFININIFISGHKTYRNLRISINEPSSHRISVKIMDKYNITVLEISHDCIYLIIKNPHSAGFQKSSLSLFQSYYCHSHSYFSLYFFMFIFCQLYDSVFYSSPHK